MLRKTLIITLLAGSILLTACAPDINGDTYSTDQTGQMDQIGKGTVVSKKAVTVNADDSHLGALAGGVTGATLGSGISGNTRGSIVGGVGGAVVGGVLGDKIENAVNSQTAFQYIVKTSKGDEFSVVQGKEPVLNVGDVVTIIYGKKLRIVPYQGN